MWCAPLPALTFHLLATLCMGPLYVCCCWHCARPKLRIVSAAWRGSAIGWSPTLDLWRKSDLHPLVPTKGSYFPSSCLSLLGPPFGGSWMGSVSLLLPRSPSKGDPFSPCLVSHRRSSTSSRVTSTPSPTQTCARVASVLDTEAPRRHHETRTSRKQQARACGPRKTAEAGVERRNLVPTKDLIHVQDERNRLVTHWTSRRPDRKCVLGALLPRTRNRQGRTRLR